MAQELKYHGACLTSLYNKERSQLRTRRRNGEINNIDFKELVTHIVEAHEVWYFH